MLVELIAVSKIFNNQTRQIILSCGEIERNELPSRMPLWISPDRLNTHRMYTRSMSQASALTLSQEALQNNLVMSNILSFLRLKDLKAASQVNHFWKYESNKFLQQQYVTIHSGIMTKYQGQEFDDYLEAIKCYQFFRIVQNHETDNFQLPTKLLTTYQAKVAGFSLTNSSSIRRLGLYSTQNGCTDFNFLATILKAVSQIEALYLCIPLNNEDFSGMKDFTGIEPFRKLSRFWVQLPYEKFIANDIPKLEQLIRKLLKLTSNIKELGFYFGDFPKKIEVYSTYLSELIKSQLEWLEEKLPEPMPFRNLSNIAVHLRHAKILLKLVQPISNFSIFVTNKDEKEPCLNTFLKKHADTLESFRLYYKLDGFQQNLVMAVQTNEFPSLPKLKSLELNLITSKVDIFDMLLGVPIRYNILENFMMIGETTGGFRQKFPQLQSLKLDVEDRVFDPWIYNRIFSYPQFDICYPQFTTLSFPETPTLIDKKMSYNDWIMFLAYTFPNVDYHQLAVARNNFY